MNVTTVIKTSKRRIIEYLISRFRGLTMKVYLRDVSTFGGDPAAGVLV